MPGIALIIFFGSGIILFFIIFCLYLVFNNNEVKRVLNHFINQAKALDPIIIENLKIRYWETSQYKTLVSINNYCDLYMFSEYMVIVRRQKFIFNYLFAPILITPNKSLVNDPFGYLIWYKPNSIRFNLVMKGQVDIKIQDSNIKNWKIEIAIKGFTPEQMKKLESINKWEFNLQQSISQK